MKPHQALRISSLIPTLAAGIVVNANAADRYWDGGTTNIGTNGNGVSTYSTGTWNTTLTNWDQGNAVAHAAWNNSNLDNAIFGGTYGTGTKTITISANVTVNQIVVNTGSTGGNRYDIGASSTQNDFAITFGGSYTDSTPAITGSTSGFLNNNINAKITGTIAGGLVVKHGTNITTPGSSGRLLLTNPNNDFVGDVVLLGGNLAAGSQFGAASNKLVLKGGALFVSGGSAGTTPFSRTIDVAAASGLSTNAATAGLQVLDLTGAITGSANLTRYVAVGGTASSEVRFSGDMSGFTGIFEQTGALATSIATIQTTATSGGAWKLSGGTLRLNAADDSHIADGTGKSDLLMNGGTLDMNGRSETINGLSGAAGGVLNSAAATTSILTLGQADATASFGGSISNGAGTVSLTKIGGGVQTLGGSSTYTGDTLVSGGTLLVTGSLGNTAVTVDGDARIGGGGTLGGTLQINAGAEIQFSTTQTLTVNGASVTFGGFSIADVAGLDNTVADGTYTLIGGTAAVNPSNLANIGIENSYALGNNKFAYFEIGSLKVHVIPESSTVLLGGLGLLGFLRRRRA